MSMTYKMLIWLAAALLVAGSARAAMACAACSSGDPTLVVMGAEQPFAGRLRVAMQLSQRSVSRGDASDGGEDMDEQQLALAASYSPWRWLTLSAAVPLARRVWTSKASGVESVLAGPTDADLRIKAFVWRDRGLAPRHLLAVQAGALVPMAGHGAVHDHGAGHHHLAGHHTVPLVGVSYAHFARPWSVFTSATLHLPMTDDGDGRSLRTSLIGQRQLTDAVGVRLGLDTRLDGQETMHGAPVTHSGGFIAFASPELMWSPATDLVLLATLRVPVLDRLRGLQDEGWVLAAAASFDL